MLCESILWSMTYCSDQERLDPLPPVIEPPTSSVRPGSQQVKAGPLFTLQASPDQPSRKGHSILPRVAQDQRPSRVNAQIQPQGSSLQQALNSQRPHPGRHISPEMEIPGQARSGGDVPFLVPSSCQSICQNYSDLHIGGDQVLPLSDHDGELLPCSDTQADGPFLYSCDVLPAADDSPPDRASEDRPLRPFQGGSGLGSSRWRAGSGRDQSFLLQGCEGPLSNSLLNRYLEHKLLDLYQQYMLESMAREGGCNEGFPSHLLASEMLLTSLDQITLQLSREGHLEAGRAKDMVLSCLLRVASGLQSSEISTPLLQISTDLQLPTATAAAAAATVTTAVTAATTTVAVTAATVTTAVTTATVAAASTSTTTAAGAGAGGLGVPQGPLNFTTDPPVKDIL
ncbi:TLR adapter interacting with SLC15A4 on the lysosome [Oncorhynchus keta]|uniref:TLR adapter interacting with SLC15A4 on the lysosome n=1 Tax=Oncorhynchus keta TaxID=8018 RepID=UPI0015F8715D|nr:TLR adapter interacting with SLC15A4 on the lysosome [Oncorhynchus keta]